MNENNKLKTIIHDIYDQIETVKKSCVTTNRNNSSENISNPRVDILENKVSHQIDYINKNIQTLECGIEKIKNNNICKDMCITKLEDKIKELNNQTLQLENRLSELERKYKNSMLVITMFIEGNDEILKVIDKKGPWKDGELIELRKKYIFTPN